MREESSTNAIFKAVESLKTHFKLRGAKLPFDYDHKYGRFTATDLNFIKFVNSMSSIRSLGRKSKEFEYCVAKQLGEKTTGSIHRVGHPRTKRRNKDAFNKYLRRLGFNRPVLLGKEKDGGFDIFWLLPLGAIPHQPLVSVQCKNGEFNMSAGDTSIGAASRSLSQHGGLQPSVHVPCVLFNDYICRERLTTKQLNFVPLGLTDLAPIEAKTSVTLL
jgi:hypothetical protein